MLIASGARIGSAASPLAKGMVVSNEPGYYEDGAFGIRIENLLVVKEAPTEFRYGGQSYFGFERLTLCPLQRKMLAPEVHTPHHLRVVPPLRLVEWSLHTRWRRAVHVSRGSMLM